MSLIMMKFMYIALILSTGCNCAQGWGGDSRMKLKDVEVLTLYPGRMSSSRRGAPVPQLQCVGGSAGCGAFTPQVVQCYNRGYDGADVHWECKTDMDNAYRFGKIEVTCEGYDHPGDKYILAGSCGLEYTIERTSGGTSNFFETNYKKHDSLSDTIGSFIFFAVIAFIIYWIWRSVFNSNEQQNQYSSTNDDYPGYPPSDSGFGRGTGSPPPAGFRPEYGYDAGDSCRRRGGEQNPFGFWTGAGLGGLFGYMMGNRNTGYGRNTSWGRNPGYSSWGSSSYMGGGSSYSSGSRSSGTRTASGFGTSRTR